MATEQSAPLGRQASVQTAAAVGAWPPTHEPPAGPPALAEPAIAAPSTNGRARGRRGLLARAVGSPGGDAAVLFALALGMRLPYQTNTLYHWDSVLYARALAAFDVSESQPHPPGYLFYVGAARLAQLALGDANASLVAVSLLGGALAVLLTYVVGRQLFGRGAGIAAALLLATAPPFWLYSGVAYPYTVLASGSLALAGLTVAYWRGRWRHPLWLGLLYGLAGGFRTDLLLFLAPLLAAAHLVCWRRDRRLGTLLAPLPGAALGTLAWLVPTAGLSQGWAVYGPLLWHQGAYVEAATRSGRTAGGPSSRTAGRCGAMPRRGWASRSRRWPTGSAAGAGAGGGAAGPARTGPAPRRRWCSSCGWRRRSCSTRSSTSAIVATASATCRACASSRAPGCACSRATRCVWRTRRAPA